MTPLFCDRLLLPLAFDLVRLAADMDATSAGCWIARFVKPNYDADWSVIPLRGPAGARHPVQMSIPLACLAYADTPLLAAAPYLREVLARLACPPQ